MCIQWARVLYSVRITQRSIIHLFHNSTVRVKRIHEFLVNVCIQSMRFTLFSLFCLRPAWKIDVSNEWPLEIKSLSLVMSDY